MAVNVATFLNAFPEFRKADQEEVRAKIGFATADVAAGTWGNRADEGIMYRTAHLLSIAPQGAQARLKSENRNTPYGVQYTELQKRVAWQVRTAGLPSGTG